MAIDVRPRQYSDLPEFLSLIVQAEGDAIHAAGGKLPSEDPTTFARLEHEEQVGVGALDEGKQSAIRYSAPWNLITIDRLRQQAQFADRTVALALGYGAIPRQCPH